LLVFLSLGFQTKECDVKKKETRMSEHQVSIDVSCRDNEKCYFDGKDIFLIIKIKNNGDSDAGFPLEFAKSKGPITRLTDNRSKLETFLPTHPPDGDLLEKLTTIPPAGSIEMEWVLTADELRQFGANVDVSVEITILGEVHVKGQKMQFKESDTIRILKRPS
jgi:hypothetical protein